METFIATLLAVAYTICVLLFIWYQRCNNRTYSHRMAMNQFLWDNHAPLNFKIKTIDDISVIHDMWVNYYRLSDSCFKIKYKTHLDALLLGRDIKKLYPKEVHHLLGE